MPVNGDLWICGGTLLDGTGRPPFRADVAIKDGRIAAIVEAPPEAPDPSTINHQPSTIDCSVLDATGCLVAPGFIDIHSHSDLTLVLDPRAVSAITQGVTLEVVGNCGHGCAPIGDP